jgi:thiol:disulfide interchange protein DsbD
MEVMTLQHGRLVGVAGVVAALVLVSGATAARQPAPAPATPTRVASTPHVSVEIVTGAERLRAGTQWLGLRFTMEPGWHIYHLNPGDGGGPPEATWQMPLGMRVAPFEWPAPERIEADGLVNFGYHGTVTLPVRLDVASGVPTSPAAVRADLRWLACKDMCVSGRGTVELRWPLSDADRAQVPAWSSAIAAARARVPKTAPGR